MKKKRQLLSLGLWVFLLLGINSVQAVIETYEFDNAEQEARYQHFIQVLRCPKCQNQNLAGSNSPIAEDLRRELAKQIRSGNSDSEIVDFMVARFGDFILYDPPLKKNTWLLWFAPGVLLLTGLGVLFHFRKVSPVTNNTGTPDVQPPAVTGDANADVLSRQSAVRVLGIGLAALCLIALVLYQRLGAGEALQTRQLVQEFYAQAGRSEAASESTRATARQLLARLEKQDQNNSSRQEQEVHFQLLYLIASLHAYLTEYELAIPYYKEYLMAIPADEQVLTEYVQVLYLAAGRQLTGRVQFVIDRALELNPHNREILALLAMHYYSQGDFPRAIQYWQKILALMSPTDAGRDLIEKAIEAAHSAASKG